MNPASPGHHRCATCGDVADRATIVAVDGASAAAELDSGERIEIAIDVTPGVRVGDVVLVHQGVAIGIVPDPSQGAPQ